MGPVLVPCLRTLCTRSQSFLLCFKNKLKFFWMYFTVIESCKDSAVCSGISSPSSPCRQQFILTMIYVSKLRNQHWCVVISLTLTSFSTKVHFLFQDPSIQSSCLFSLFRLWSLKISQSLFFISLTVSRSLSQVFCKCP